MLEARIHQLQSDVVLDVQHANVQFVKAPSSGSGVLSGKGPKSTPQEKGDIPKSGQTVAKGAYKSQPSRWIEKLTEEKKKKLKRQQRLQQKIQKNVKEKPIAKSTRSKGSSLLPGTAYKTISTTAKKTVPLKKSQDRMKLADEICAAVSSTVTSTAATAGTAARAKEQAELEELERRLSQQVGQWTSSSNPKRLQEDSKGTACGDIRLSIRSYLEACTFVGDIERAHRFLLSQHRVVSRRKHLNTAVYNIMMRVWAKKVSLMS